jgi:hypothetical protein
MRYLHSSSLGLAAAHIAEPFATLGKGIDIQPALERDRHWHALGLFDLKEDFVATGLGLLPAYWVCWRRPVAGESGPTRAALTAVLAFIVWWGFLVGHVMNDIMGFGS